MHFQLSPEHVDLLLTVSLLLDQFGRSPDIVRNVLVSLLEDLLHAIAPTLDHVALTIAGIAQVRLGQPVEGRRSVAQQHSDIRKRVGAQRPGFEAVLHRPVNGSSRIRIVHISIGSQRTQHGCVILRIDGDDPGGQQRLGRCKRRAPGDGHPVAFDFVVESEDVELGL